MLQSLAMLSESLYRSSTAAGRRLSVLLAEDDPEFRLLLARALEADGILVSSVDDGRKALELLLLSLDGSERPDVLVSDVRMPNLSGIDVLRSLRRAGDSLPVILITGFGDTVARAEVDALGAAVVLAKPFDFDDLRTALRNLGSISRLRCR